MRLVDGVIDSEKVKIEIANCATARICVQVRRSALHVLPSNDCLNAFIFFFFLQIKNWPLRRRGRKSN